MITYIEFSNAKVPMQMVKAGATVALKDGHLEGRSETCGLGHITRFLTQGSAGVEYLCVEVQFADNAKPCGVSPTNLFFFI